MRNLKSYFLNLKSSSGFTLIEILVVIAVVAVILGLAVPNYLGARQRARDIRRKSELVQMKNALRLYYNDYQRYPGTSSGKYIVGCGTTGDELCSADSAFAAGAAGSETVYMRILPQAYPGEYLYTRNPSKPGDTDDFLLKAVLDNASDTDIAASQARCGVTGLAGITSQHYVVCAD